MRHIYAYIGWFSHKLKFCICSYPSTKSQGQFHKRCATQQKLDALNLIAAHVLFPLPQTSFHNTPFWLHFHGRVHRKITKPNIDMRKISFHPSTFMTFGFQNVIFFPLRFVSVVIFVPILPGLVRSLEHVASNLDLGKMGGDFPRCDWGRCCLKIYRYS